MSWKYNGSEITENDIYDIVAECYDEDDFEQYLNDNYDVISVFDYDYDAGTVFRKLDEIAFICAYDEECDTIARQIINDEEATDCMGFGIHYIEDE